MVIGLILNWRTLHKDMTLAEAWKVGFRLMLSEQFGLALTLLVCWLITR